MKKILLNKLHMPFALMIAVVFAALAFLARASADHAFRELSDAKAEIQELKERLLVTEAQAKKHGVLLDIDEDGVFVWQHDLPASAWTTRVAIPFSEEDAQ